MGSREWGVVPSARPCCELSNWSSIYDDSRALVRNPQAAISYRRNPDSAPTLVDHDEGTRQQVCFVLARSGHDREPLLQSLNEPRRHLDGRQYHLRGVDAQRRPGFEPRRHRARRGRADAPRRPLNEGRGSNPGDTGKEGLDSPEPVLRSTKAGVRTPATLPILAGQGPIERIAQHCGFERLE